MKKLKSFLFRKSRTREHGGEYDTVNVLKRTERSSDQQKLMDACKTFACQPWMGIYVETAEYADLYLTSLKHYEQKYLGRKDLKVYSWKMSKQYTEQYDTDPYVKHIRFDLTIRNWTW